MAILLTKIWKELPGKYFCVSTKSRTGKWHDEFFKRSEFKDVEDYIQENLDKDVYWCIHGFRKPRRLKEHAEIPKMLWADLDEVNPRDLGSLMPTVAWESSPGRYAAVWRTDGYMTEETNQGLTNLIGADPGGWDLTQVLRVPNTTNYKYASAPKVKLLWTDGPDYKTTDIEKKLPKEKKTDKKSTDEAKRIYKKYEKKFNTFIRRELLNGKPVKGKRSEVIWKLVNEIVEAGCTSDETFELLRASPWNKFRDRRDGDAQLKREVDKALSKHINVSINNSETFEEEEEESDEKPYKYLGVSMADVVEEEIDWLWYPYLARGEMTILEGDPGLGKSYLALMIAKGIVDGEKLQSPKPRKLEKGRVAYFDTENNPSTTTKKRLRLNGCVNFGSFFQEDRAFSVEDEDEFENVHRAMAAFKPSLVVFDTINIYTGSADTHKASETQQMLRKFVDIARRYNCAVLVLRHLTKSTKEKALYRGQGSIAFAGLARVVMTVGIPPRGEDEDFDEEARVVAITKLNITKPPKALMFYIRELPDIMKESDRSKFEWGEYVELTADDIITGPPATEGKKVNYEDVEAWLTEFLDDGPQEVSKILSAGKARSYSRRTLYKISERLGLRKENKGFGKTRQGMWALPGMQKKKKKTTPNPE